MELSLQILPFLSVAFFLKQQQPAALLAGALKIYMFRAAHDHSESEQRRVVSAGQKPSSLTLALGVVMYGLIKNI